jgi:ABC-2 type transport system ATP-binding protein
VLGVDMMRRGGRQAVAAQVGFLPQTVGFYPGYRLCEYVAYAAWLKGVERRELDQRVRAALDVVGLSDRASSRMRTLSGGMIKRAGIAQAIVARPRLLVLDEPAAGLDPAQRIELRRTIRGLAQSASVFISTHAVEDVKHIADTVLVLRAGEIVFSGTVHELEAAAEPNADGDTALERGYLTKLRATGASR